MTARPTFSADEIARLRLQALGLVGDPVASDPVGVVAHHLAMQAQDFPASRWAVGSRLPESTEADVLAAYDARTIVRSWPMRGTVHAVAAEDLPWMLEHLGPLGTDMGQGLHEFQTVFPRCHQCPGKGALQACLTTPLPFLQEARH